MHATYTVESVLANIYCCNARVAFFIRKGEEKFKNNPCIPMDYQRSSHNWWYDNTDRSCSSRCTRIHNSILRIHRIQSHIHNRRNVRNYHVHHTHNIHHRRYRNHNHHIRCRNHRSPLLANFHRIPLLASFHRIPRNRRNQGIHNLYIPDCIQGFRSSRT